MAFVSGHPGRGGIGQQMVPTSCRSLSLDLACTCGFVKNSADVVA